MRLSTLAKRNGASFVVIAWAVIFVAVALWCTRRGEALPPDSTDYAEAALALVRGQGVTINHVAFHTFLFPAVRHPLEVHGLLVPLQIAPLFALFGPDGGLVRIPSIVFAGCIGLLVYVVGRRLAGAFAGSLAAVLILGRLDLVFVSVLGADDIGAALFGLLALYCFERSASGERRWILATGLAATIAGLQKFTGLILPAAFAAYLVLGARREPTRPETRKNWLMAAIPVVVTVALYVHRNIRVYGTLGSPYGGVEWFGKRNFRDYFTYFPKPPTVSYAWAELGTDTVIALTVEQIRAVLLTILSEPVLFIGLPALVWLVWKKPRFAVGALLYIGGIVFIVCVPHHLEARYLAPLVPICAVSTGVLAESVATRFAAAVAPERRQRLWLVFGAAVAAYGAFGAYRTFTAIRFLGAQMATAHEGCPDALEYLRRSSAEDEPVLTSNPWLIAWSGKRPAVNAPTNGAEALLTVARHYGVRWLFTGVPVIGAQDLDASVHDVRVAEGLHPVLEFHGATCDVYRVDPGTRP
jgi:4-amino-4-deoxy-L-arabinose transferase-like glycosyltransferase